MRLLADTIAKALRVEPGYDEIPDLPMAWRLGIYAATPANRFPVFLSLSREPDELHDLVAGLVLQCVDPLLVLGTTRAGCRPRTEALLRQRASIFLPLEELVGVAADGKLVALHGLNACLPGHPADACEAPPGTVVIERYECGDGLHWVVDGVDKGVFYKRPEAIKGRILEILFEQIGNGWVPHTTFMHACGWSDQRYFGDSTEPKLMQKHLTDVRNFLGVKVVFSKKHGVRFAENVVKSRK
jgi:hypothetical protein